MAETYKNLGGGLDSAVATLEDLYTVPASTSTVVSTIQVCNRGATTTFRIAIRVGGAAINNKHYVYFDTPLTANESYSITEGYTLAATDVISVQSASGDVSFNAFGCEVT